MVSLDVLPRWARENLVRFLQPADALRALPFVSGKTLAALQGLRLPIGEYKALTVEAAVQQAHALRRAWDLGTLLLYGFSEATDISALADCATLHTLRVKYHQVADVSALAGCALLRTLDVRGCDGLTDVSALAGCASLRTLDLVMTVTVDAASSRQVRSKFVCHGKLNSSGGRLRRGSEYR